MVSQPESEHSKSYLAIAQRIWAKLASGLDAGARQAPKIVMN